jgi:3-dehydroquinate synthetase
VPIPRRVDPVRLLALTKRDKKSRGGRARFVLLRAPGRAAVLEVPDDYILRAARELL